jgi:MFS family permease
MTPIPYRKITVLGLMLAANNCSIWMIFSFLPFMTSYFNPQLSIKELGYRAGYLGSAFSGGSLLGNLMWGVIADRYGRRPALLLGLVGTIIAAVLFGFSPTFFVAVFMRFLWGFLNGNVGVGKTYIGEILDDTNTAKGMPLYGVIGGVGRFFGPIIGGYLSIPAEHYDIFKKTVFDTYPFALPSLVVAVNCLIILIFGYFELPETLKIKPKKKKNVELKYRKKGGLGGTGKSICICICITHACIRIYLYI